MTAGEASKGMLSAGEAFGSLSGEPAELSTR